jgi:hypothetical protein
MSSLRTAAELQAGAANADIFARSPETIEQRLEQFPKYVRRQHLKRFLALYELFKLALPVKGSVIECGVFRGFGLMSWAKLSTILEPENLTRRIYGFDSFSGFPQIDAADRSNHTQPQPGDLAADSYAELQALIAEYDRDRFLGHIDKVHLVRGDVMQTIPRFIDEHPHLVVSLLFLDFDLFAPTRLALETFLPRMPRGAVLAFDELDNPRWPGETLALAAQLGIGRLRLQRLPWDPYISWAVLE